MAQTIAPSPNFLGFPGVRSWVRHFVFPFFSPFSFLLRIFFDVLIAPLQ